LASANHTSTPFSFRQAKLTRTTLLQRKRLLNPKCEQGTSAATSLALRVSARVNKVDPAI
jgi:hypothetical protein